MNSRSALVTVTWNGELTPGAGTSTMICFSASRVGVKTVLTKSLPITNAKPAGPTCDWVTLNRTSGRRGLTRELEPEGERRCGAGADALEFAERKFGRQIHRHEGERFAKSQPDLRRDRVGVTARDGPRRRMKRDFCILRRGSDHKTLASDRLHFLNPERRSDFTVNRGGEIPCTGCWAVVNTHVGMNHHFSGCTLRDGDGHVRNLHVGAPTNVGGLEHHVPP